MNHSHNLGTSKYLIGNGKMMASLSGGDMEQVYGMPYSSPSAFTLELDNACDCKITRCSKTAIWKNVIAIDSIEVAVVRDFAVGDYPCISRQITTDVPLCFILRRHGEMQKNFAWVLDSSEEYPQAKTVYQFNTMAGNYFYACYPITFPQCYQVAVLGSAAMESGSVDEWRIIVQPGTSEILIVGGPSVRDCEENTDFQMTLSTEERFEMTDRLWKSYFVQNDFNQLVPIKTPFREKLLSVLEDTIILLKTQQAEDGGILAGYCYKMSYVRDNYGDFRGFMALGCLGEAKKLLLFYYKTFCRDGVIHNAQPMGFYSQFHFAENDEVEITGYLIMMVKDYYEKVKDEELLAGFFPMMKWAMDMQIRNIAAGMIPFNGDETYIASGVLPRHTIEDGSAEATLLFLLAGEFFVDAATKWKWLSTDEIKHYSECIEETRSMYKDNFIVENRYIANNPKRYERITHPNHRYAICATKGESDHCVHLGWTKRTAEGTYLCTSCRLAHLHAEEKHDIYSVESVSLFPVYISQNFLPDVIFKTRALELAEHFYLTGQFTSLENSIRTIGYDYGLLLFNLASISSPYGEYIYQKVLDLADECRSYAEFYNKGIPSGTRYRAWESAVNIVSILEYVHKKYGGM